MNREEYEKEFLECVSRHIGHPVRFGDRDKKSVIPAPDGYNPKADIFIEMELLEAHMRLGCPEIIVVEDA